MGILNRLRNPFGSSEERNPLASVLFPGGVPPRVEELSGLSPNAFTIQREPDVEGAHWWLRLTHPVWGAAEVICFRSPELPPAEIIEPCLNLTADEKAAIVDARSVVTVRLAETTSNILADRKRLLRFGRAVMDQYGIAVVDHFSWLFWSRQSLEEELAHDADLDVSALYVLHAVTDEETGVVGWLHSHGLAEIGYFDFDVLSPSNAVLGRGSDVLRGIAFGIIEGHIQPSMASFTIAQPGGVVSLVEASEFARRASPEVLALWPADEDHRSKRSILCEPRTGLLSRWFNKVAPSKFLSVADPEQVLIQFSPEATDRMSRRARATYGVFRSLFEEFRELNLPIMVKCGIRTDSGGETDREHLWFSVHELADDTIDATLDNQPFDVSALHQGDRRTLSVDTLTEWRILTPAGSISPDNMTVARAIRDNKDEIKKMMAEGAQ